MPRTIKHTLGTPSRLGIALLACILFAELIVFRFIIVPNDPPPNTSVNGVVRYVARTTTNIEHPDGRYSAVTINDHGWNSSKQRYRRSPPPGRTRIAVVGDSYVHGANVNPDQGFPEVLEHELNARSTTPVDVIRFGMEGAPLSQYLHMLRQEVLLYRPDVVVVQLTHGNFVESIYGSTSRGQSRFMKIRRNNDGTVTEIPPSRVPARLAEPLQHSALFRYVGEKTSNYLHPNGRHSKHVLVHRTGHKPKLVSSAASLVKFEDMDSIAFSTFHIMEKMQGLAQGHGFKILFAMDGVREAIYANRTADEYMIGELNRIAANTAANLNLPFVNLQKPFATHHSKERRRFESSYDWQWNRLGHHIAGKAIADHFLENPGLLRKRTAQVGGDNTWITQQ